MVLSYNKRGARYRAFSYLLLTLACATGCGGGGGSKTGNESGTNDDDSEILSANFLLGPEDYEKFRPGRPQTELLDDLQWRGDLEYATTYNGKRGAAISYGLFGGPLRDHGTSVLAIFIDDRFEKLVRWPKWDAKIKFKIKIGDFSYLIRAVESDAVTVLELEREMSEMGEHSNSTDPGLTAAWLLLRGGIQAARAPALRKNAVLRDQFNAARLRIGMRQTEVESELKAKPILSGEVQAGAYRIYGSTESLDITDDLHYSNILVLFGDDKVIGIYSGGWVPGGYRFEKMREWFVELPERRDK